MYGSLLAFVLIYILLQFAVNDFSFLKEMSVLCLIVVRKTILGLMESTLGFDKKREKLLMTSKTDAFYSFSFVVFTLHSIFILT